MDTTDYYVDLYRQRAKRVRWLMLLLVTLFGFTLVDFFVTQMRFDDFHSRLPILLYDFEQKYSQPLTEWWHAYISSPESVSLGASDPAVIRFQNRSKLDTDRGINWHRIPLLDQFLTPYQPSVQDSRTLFGWGLPIPVYLVVALSAPSVILMWVLIDLQFLRRTRVFLRASTPSKTTALIMQSILVDRLEPDTVTRQWSRAAVVTLALFALASAAAVFVITAPLNGSTVHIEGALYLNLSQFPRVSRVAAPFPNPPEFWVASWLTAIAVDALLSMFIWRELANRRS